MLPRRSYGRQKTKRHPDFVEHRVVFVQQMVDLTCPECGKQFQRRKSKSGLRMCSLACAKIHDIRVKAKRRGKAGIKVMRHADGSVRVELVTKLACRHCGKFFEVSGHGSQVLRHTCSAECRKSHALAKSIALSLLYRSVPAIDPVKRDRRCCNCRRPFFYKGRGFKIVCSMECSTAWSKKRRLYRELG